ncbi:MAG TPA: MFS transporter, partial [Ktedonobacterales bacterium]|nr:MFS transporter [Ktedonobacterales bacterium]
FRALSRNAQLYLISNSIQAITAGALLVIYTLYLTALGYDASFIGLLAVVGTVGGALGIVPSQFLVNRFGWRTMLIWSDMIGGVAIFLQLVLPTPPLLILTSIGLGASVAIVLVINAPFLAANSTARDRTALYGLNNALQFLASILGSLLGGALPALFMSSAMSDSWLLQAHIPLLLANSQARAYQLTLLVIGALAIPSIIPIFLIREAPRERTASEPKVAHPWRVRLDGLLVQIRVGVQGVIGRFSLFQALLGVGAGLWFPYFNIYVVKHLGLSTFLYGLLTATATVLLAVASLIAAPLSERFGKVPVIVICHLCALPFLVLMGAIPVLPVVCLAYLIRGTLANIPGPALQSFLMEAVPERERVTANGVYNVSWQIAWALGAFAGGLIVNVLGYQAPMLVAVPWYGGAALLFAWFFWRGRQRAGEADEIEKPQTEADMPLPASEFFRRD